MQKYSKFEHAVVFSKDGECLLELSSALVDEVGIPDVSEYLKDSTVIHNHPKGTFFSFHDIKIIFSKEIKELQVVSPTINQNYSLTNNGDRYGALGCDKEFLLKVRIEAARRDMEAGEQSE